MYTIKKYTNETDSHTIERYCIAEFMKENIDDFKMGYRLYSDDEDITENVTALLTCRNLTMMKPSGVSAAVGWAIAAVVASVAVSVAIVALMPKPEAPSTSARSQSSATNSLGARNNEAAIGERIDDIWGKVSKHVPRLMQLPHFRFTDNKETENFALIMGQGQYLIENVRDGDTDFSRLQGGQFNAYNPGHEPNSGDAPDMVIGDVITRNIKDVAQSRELQGAELLPPNDLEIGGEPVWVFDSINSDIARVTLENNDTLKLDLNDYYTVGEQIVFVDTWIAKSLGTVDVYNDAGELLEIDELSDLFDASGTFEITGVQAGYVEFDTGSVDFTGTTGKQALILFYRYISTYENILTETKAADHYYYPTASDRLSYYGEYNYSPIVSAPFTGSLGPYFIPENVDTVSLNLVASNGFYKYKSNTETNVSANINVIIDELDSNDEVTGRVREYNFTFQSNQSNLTQQAAETIDITMPYSRGQITAKRTTDRDKADETSSVDKVDWRDLYFYTEIGAQDYGDVTIAQVVIPYSITASSVKERQINADMTRYVNRYSDGVYGPSSTIADVVTALALDSRNGRLSLDDIDADLFQEVEAQLIAYYGRADYVEVGYDLDSTKIRFQESFQLFWDAVNCRSYSQGATYRVYPDILRADSSKQFTHRNKILGTETKDRKYNNEYDGVELTYRSNKTGAFETIILHVNGIDSNARKEIELSGATQETTAKSRANRELNIIKYQRFNCAFEADGIARLTVPGERIDNVDSTRIVKRDNNENIYQVYDGQVVEVNGLEVELSQEVYFESGENHSIRFTDSEGNLLEAITCTKGPTAFHVILTTTPSKDLYDGYLLEKTSFTFASDASRLSLPYLIVGTEASDASGLQTRKLTAINYSTDYYKDDIN